MSRLEDVLREAAERLGRQVDRSGATDEISRRTRKVGRRRGRSVIVLLTTALVAVGVGFPLAQLTVLRSDRGSSAPPGRATPGTKVTTPTSAPAHPTLPSGDFGFAARPLDPQAQIGIYRVSGEGTNLAIVVPNVSSSVSWSPDGARLAFSRSVSEAAGELRIVNRDGTDQTVVTDFHDPHGVSWSPDGTVIAFTIGFAPPPYDIDPGDIYVVGVDGSGLTRLTHSSLQCNDLHPAWSPDGSALAFDRDCDPPYSIHVVNADGSGDREILAIQDTAQGISWSPDGSRIAFAVTNNGKTGIYTVAPDGKDLTMVTEGFDVSPVWLSPEELAFVRNGEIWGVDISTGEASLILPLTGLRVFTLSWVPN